MGVSVAPVSSTVVQFNRSVPSAQQNERVMHVQDYDPEAKMLSGHINGIMHRLLIQAFVDNNGITHNLCCCHPKGVRNGQRGTFFCMRDADYDVDVNTGHAGGLRATAVITQSGERITLQN